MIVWCLVYVYPTTYLLVGSQRLEQQGLDMQTLIISPSILAHDSVTVLPTTRLERQYVL